MFSATRYATLVTVMGLLATAPVNAETSTRDRELRARDVGTVCAHAPDEAVQRYAAGDGTCPAVAGDCDDPDVRDLFIPDGGDRVDLRMKINVFCDDDGSNCAVTQVLLDDQVEFANDAFNEGNLHFVYTTEFIDDTVANAANSTSDIAAVKAQYADDPQHQMNVYLVSGNAGGAAVFPWWPAALASGGGFWLEKDAVADDKHWFAHEAGHAVGLWHTHNGTQFWDCGDSGLIDQFEPCYEYVDGTNADTGGDFCSDTAPTPSNRSCDQPDGEDCDGTPWGTTDIDNIMGYSIDEDASGYTECRTRFTEQQWGRMNCWTNARLGCWIDVEPGDVNCDGDVDISDAIYIIQHVSQGGPAPCPLPVVADFDCNGEIETADAQYLLNYLFVGGPAPECCAD